jgi:hypothetical protein
MSAQEPTGLPPMPVYSLPQTPVGCICPPGANLQCENPTCPRKPRPPLGAVARAST